ncbi:MAG: TRAP transporter TatT component family protein [Deltaproteobacteria bacterium]|nr:TRAP transporter TatT component family protein [Deltaproteobacteria bacterium]
MRSLIGLVAALSLLLLTATFPQAAGEPDKMAQADGILASPSLDFQKAQSALVLYEDLLQGSPQLMTRLSRACFILGNLAPVKERGNYYEQGLHYAEKLLAQEPNGVAGHYWKALNLGGLADVGSEIVGFKLLPQIMDELKRALAIDQSYDDAGAHRVMGRIFFQAPSWPISVGDKKKSLAHLTAAVHQAPNYSTNHLYLGETLLDMQQKDQARAEFEKVLQNNQHAITPQDLEEDRQQARRLLDELKKKK